MVGASVLTNITGLKTDNIINGYEMFGGCSNLNIQWSNWNFLNLEAGTYMFWSCNIYNFSSSFPKLQTAYNMFSGCTGVTVNSLQNIVKGIPDRNQMTIYEYEKDTLTYFGLTNDQINMLSDEYKQMAADKHWNIPGFMAREKVDILLICNNLGAIFNYNGINEYPMKVDNKSYADCFLQSKNQGKPNSNSSAIINFTNELVALCGNKYYMNIYYSCENSYDYLQIFKMNNGSSSWSQIGENKYTGSNSTGYLHSSLDLENIRAGDQLRFTYHKDGSSDVGLDECLISIYGYKTDGAYEITYSLANEPEITKYKVIPKE